MKPTRRDVRECLSSGRQKCGSHKGKDLGCTEDIEVFTRLVSEAYPSPDWEHAGGRYHKKDDCVRQHFRAFWLYGSPQHPQPLRNELRLSALLYLPPFPMLDEHTLHYTHLQNSKETIVWACAFSLCMSLTLRVAVSIRNNSVAKFVRSAFFWRVFGFHLIAPYIMTVPLDHNRLSDPVMSCDYNQWHILG